MTPRFDALAVDPAGLDEVYALVLAGVEGFMVVDGPDDHLTTVPSIQEAWQFPSAQGAAMAARTLSRITGAAVQVVALQAPR